MIRVSIAPCDTQAVYEHRARWPAEALHAQKEIELVPIEEPRVNMAIRRHGPEPTEPLGIANLPDIDVLVLTRVLSKPLVDVIPIIQRQGVAVVVDIDDDFRRLPSTMEHRRKIQPNQNAYYNWRLAAAACSKADLVTCSTKALMSWAPHGRVAVLRNTVPARYLTVNVPMIQGCVGWSGSIGSHPGVLEVTHGGVAKAIETYGGSFRLVGKDEGVAQALGLKSGLTSTGVVEHGRFPFAIAPFHVGITPLADNAFNRAKSWLKPLQLMALGIPFVGSPTYEYSLLYNELVSYGCEAAGALARPRGRDWYRETIRHLRTPENERQEMAAATRKLVADSHTVEGESWAWAEAWSEAVKHRRDQRVAAHTATA